MDHDWIYVAEWGNYRVSVFTTSGEFITSFGKPGRGEGEFIIHSSFQVGLPGTDDNGYVYVCDSGCIQVF